MSCERRVWRGGETGALGPGKAAIRNAHCQRRCGCFRIMKKGERQAECSGVGRIEG